MLVIFVKDENIKPTKRRKRIIADSDSSDNEEKKEKATAKDVELVIYC